MATRSLASSKSSYGNTSYAHNISKDRKLESSPQRGVNSWRIGGESMCDYQQTSFPDDQKFAGNIVKGDDVRVLLIVKELYGTYSASSSPSRLESCLRPSQIAFSLLK